MIRYHAVDLDLRSPVQAKNAADGGVLISCLGRADVTGVVTDSRAMPPRVVMWVRNSQLPIDLDLPLCLVVTVVLARII